MIYEKDFKNMSEKYGLVQKPVATLNLAHPLKHLKQYMFLTISVKDCKILKT